MSILNLDPTRTALLRNKLINEIQFRFSLLAKDLTELLVSENVLGLTTNADWSKSTDAGKIEKFRKWMDTSLDNRILKKVDKAFWTDPYMKESYDKATQRVWETLPKAKTKEAQAASYRQFKTQFQASSKGRLELLQSGIYNEIEGLSKNLKTRLTSVIIEGISKGLPAEKVGEMIADRISKIGISRAATIARTEIARANSEGILDAMESMGMKDVVVNVEWKTRGKPCPLCKSLQNVVMTVEQARGLFPRHPNCYCSPMPSTNTVNKRRLVSKIKASLKQETNSSWSGSDLTRKK